MVSLEDLFPSGSPASLQACSGCRSAFGFRHRQRSLSMLQPDGGAVRGSAAQPAFADRQQELDLLLRLRVRRAHIQYMLGVTKAQPQETVVAELDAVLGEARGVSGAFDADIGLCRAQ